MVNKFKFKYRNIMFGQAHLIISLMPESDNIRVRLYYKKLMIANLFEIVDDMNYMRRSYYNFIDYYKHELRDQQ